MKRESINAGRYANRDVYQPAAAFPQTYLRVRPEPIPPLLVVASNCTHNADLFALDQTAIPAFRHNVAHESIRHPRSGCFLELHPSKLLSSVGTPVPMDGIKFSINTS
jgi:hypothetical protein